MKKTDDQGWKQVFCIPDSAENTEDGWTGKNPWKTAEICPDFESSSADGSPKSRLCGTCIQCVFVGRTNYYCKKGH